VVLAHTPTPYKLLTGNKNGSKVTVLQKEGLPQADIIFEPPEYKHRFCLNKD
jgi:hypothetical protein